MAGKDTIVAATSLARRSYRTCFLFLKIQPRTKPWLLCLPWRPYFSWQWFGVQILCKIILWQPILKTFHRTWFRISLGILVNDEWWQIYEENVSSCTTITHNRFLTIDHSNSCEIFCFSQNRQNLGPFLENKSDQKIWIIKTCQNQKLFYEIDIVQWKKSENCVLVVQLNTFSP